MYYYKAHAKMTRPVLFFYNKNTGLRPVLTLPKYDTLNYTTPLKRLVEGFIFRYNVRTGLTKISIGTKIILAPQKIKLFSHTSSRIAAQTVVESFCSSSTRSAKTLFFCGFSLQREQRTKPEARFFWVLCAEYIYLLGIIDLIFRLLWKQQTTGRSKISSTRSPSRTFSGILLLLLFFFSLFVVVVEIKGVRPSSFRMRFPLAEMSSGRRLLQRRTLRDDAPLTMGHKLKLAEEVEKGLEDAGCPLPLRAHQIVGLDTARVFPVVQWLTTRAMALTNHREGRREEDFGDDELWRRTRAHGRRFWNDDDERVERNRKTTKKKSSLTTSTTSLTRRVERIQLNNSSTRTLRRTAESNAHRDLENEGEDKIINGCLMEFGHRVSGKRSLYYYFYNNRGSGAMATRAAAAARNREEKETNGDEGTSIGGGGGGGGEKEKEKETLNEEEEEEAAEEEEELLKREEAK